MWAALTAIHTYTADIVARLLQRHCHKEDKHGEAARRAGLSFLAFLFTDRGGLHREALDFIRLLARRCQLMATPYGESEVRIPFTSFFLARFSIEANKSAAHMWRTGITPGGQDLGLLASWSRNGGLEPDFERWLSFSAETLGGGMASMLGRRG